VIIEPGHELAPGPVRRECDSPHSGRAERATSLTCTNLHAGVRDRAYHQVLEMERPIQDHLLDRVMAPGSRRRGLPRQQRDTYLPGGVGEDDVASGADCARARSASRARRPVPATIPRPPAHLALALRTAPLAGARPRPVPRSTASGWVSRVRSLPPPRRRAQEGGSPAGSARSAASYVSWRATFPTTRTSTPFGA
jgi:hypothetical protein